MCTYTYIYICAYIQHTYKDICESEHLVGLKHLHYTFPSETKILHRHLSSERKYSPLSAKALCCCPGVLYWPGNHSHLQDQSGCIHWCIKSCNFPFALSLLRLLKPVATTFVPSISVFYAFQSSVWLKFNTNTATCTQRWKEHIHNKKWN